MVESKDKSQFKARWLTLDEAAAELDTTAEGLLQSFGGGATSDLPMYVRSDQVNFSGMCTPFKYALRLNDEGDLRKSMSDDYGHIAVDHRRERAEDWERWFQLIGVFRILPGTLKRIARERSLAVCPVAPCSWWSADAPVPKDVSGNPTIRFDIGNWDKVSGSSSVRFDQVCFKASDVRSVLPAPQALDEAASVHPLEGEVPTFGKWPWGDHETEALRHLAAAGRKFWMNHDLGQPDTVPTTDEVRSWLMARGVGKTPATYMASFLRADGLKPGPRKE